MSRASDVGRSRGHASTQSCGGRLAGTIDSFVDSDHVGTVSGRCEESRACLSPHADLQFFTPTYSFHTKEAGDQTSSCGRFLMLCPARNKAHANASTISEMATTRKTVLLKIAPKPRPAR